MRNSYIILGLTICLLYYLIFKYKYDMKWKVLALIATIGGMIVSIGSIIEGYFVSSKTLVRDIFIVPITITIIAFFSFAIPMAWRMRKDPEKKVMIYTAFGVAIFMVIFIIVCIILAQLGFFG